MNKLYIDIDTIVSEKGNDVLFEKNVIHNLYRIYKQLNYAIMIVAEKNILPPVSNALEILKNESIAFDVCDKTDENSPINLYISKKRFASWDEVYRRLESSLRKVSHTRNTNETQITIELNPDGKGVYQISTGLGFFNHMLEQLSKHSNMDLMIDMKGDLHIDEHHTIEDTAIALGEAMTLALGNKKGMERYGFLLPMDDCLAQVAIDFGGRSWLVWDAEFEREKIGDVPTEMFYHFFKSFCDAAKCNLNIKAEGTNEHHKIESIFKAFAKAVKMAVSVNYESAVLPTTKGVL
jgi:imidazoleglycerol-phosphate dehydratase / histidinol-phosphatase